MKLDDGYYWMRSVCEKYNSDNTHLVQVRNYNDYSTIEYMGSDECESIRDDDLQRRAAQGYSYSFYKIKMPKPPWQRRKK